MTIPQHTNALFISDLHLTEERPELTRAFFRFLDWLPPTTDALFILGDLFEYWVGDDIHSPLSREVAVKLNDVSKTRTIELYFLVGNRDFTVGADYCRAANMTLIEDNTKFSIGDFLILVSHGDLLCTDDKEYQRYRKVIRHPFVLKPLLKLPARLRLAMANRIRKASKNKHNKKSAIVDVNQTAVQAEFKKHSVQLLIHGHTHAPCIHQLEPEQSRMVLGDWDINGWYGFINEDDYGLKRFLIDQPTF